MIDPGSIFLVLALVILVGIFVSRPLLERRSQRVTAEEHTISELLAERDRILDALQELDFDREMGKIPEEDYPRQRALLVQRGAEVLRRLDAMQEEHPGADVDARLEVAMTARRAGLQASEAQPLAASDVAPEIYDDELENLIAARRRELNGKAAGFCPHCGHAIQQRDRFCAKCGATLKQVAQT